MGKGVLLVIVLALFLIACEADLFGRAIGDTLEENFIVFCGVQEFNTRIITTEVGTENTLIFSFAFEEGSGGGLEPIGGINPPGDEEHAGCVLSDFFSVDMNGDGDTEDPEDLNRLSTDSENNLLTFTHSFENEGVLTITIFASFNSGETMRLIIPFDVRAVPVLGCNDPSATNYDPEATEDDGSCEYVEESYLDIISPTNFEVEAQGGNFNFEFETNADWLAITSVYWLNLDIESGTEDEQIVVGVLENTGEERTGNIELQSIDGSVSGIVTVTQSGVLLPGMECFDCQANECFLDCDLECFGSSFFENHGDGVCDDNNPNLNCVVENSDIDLFNDGGDCEIESCLDPDADNYNPSGTVPCADCCYYLYDEVSGCTNVSSPNYDVDAIVDDGSCLLGCFEVVEFDDCESLGMCDTNADGSVDSDDLDYLYYFVNTFNMDFCGFGDYTCYCNLNADEFIDSNDLFLFVDLFSGCTDPTALNYDPVVVIDDGSCEYIYGCMDVDATNYDEDATGDDGSCEYDFVEGGGGPQLIFGCMDSGACNYNPDATSSGEFVCWFNVTGCSCDDGYGAVVDECGVCNGDNSCLGCTDTSAANYNDSVTVDDESCIYPISASNLTATGNDNMISLTWDHPSSEYTFNILRDDAIYEWDIGDISFDDLDLGFDETHCYKVMALLDGLEADNLSNEACATTNSLPDEDVFGCTDFDACNFDPEANVNDGGCEYADLYLDCSGVCLSDVDADLVCDELEVLGCTDETALNYDDLATEDDGSCEYELITLNLQPDIVAIISFTDFVGDNSSIDSVFSPEYFSEEPDSVFITSFGSGSTTYYAGEGWYGSLDFIEVYTNYTIVSNFSFNYSYPGLVIITSGSVGCTDEFALNYNSSATVGDDSCIYPEEVSGCTDSGANNYDDSATVVDDSCLFSPLIEFSVGGGYPRIVNVSIFDVDNISSVHIFRSGPNDGSSGYVEPVSGFGESYNSTFSLFGVGIHNIAITVNDTLNNVSVASLIEVIESSDIPPVTIDVSISNEDYVLGSEEELNFQVSLVGEEVTGDYFVNYTIDFIGGTNATNIYDFSGFECVSSFNEETQYLGLDCSLLVSEFSLGDGVYYLSVYTYSQDNLIFDYSTFAVASDSEEFDVDVNTSYGDASIEFCFSDTDDCVDSDASDGSFNVDELADVEYDVEITFGEFTIEFDDVLIGGGLNDLNLSYEVYEDAGFPSVEDPSVTEYLVFAHLAIESELLDYFSGFTVVYSGFGVSNSEDLVLIKCSDWDYGSYQCLSDLEEISLEIISESEVFLSSGNFSIYFFGEDLLGDVEDEGDGGDDNGDGGDNTGGTTSTSYGCTDSSATNYDSSADVDDGSCSYPSSEVLGCTDEDALNYDSLATIDDSTCGYSIDLITNLTGEMNASVNDSEPVLNDSSPPELQQPFTIPPKFFTGLIIVLFLGVLTYFVVKRKKVFDELYEESSKPPKPPKV